MGSFIASVAVQWWLRRFWELGGLLGSFLSFILGLFALMPEPMQQTLIYLLQGNWEDLSVKSAIGLAVWAFTQWRSYRATTKAQIVTTTGQQITLPDLAKVDPAKATAVEEFAVTALGQQKDTIIGRLLKWGQKS